jgi:hypothetical protein
VDIGPRKQPLVAVRLRMPRSTSRPTWSSGHGTSSASSCAEICATPSLYPDRGGGHHGSPAGRSVTGPAPSTASLRKHRPAARARPSSPRRAPPLEPGPALAPSPPTPPPRRAGGGHDPHPRPGRTHPRRATPGASRLERATHSARTIPRGGARWWRRRKGSPLSRMDLPKPEVTVTTGSDRQGSSLMEFSDRVADDG